MPSEADVRSALADLCAAALYPGQDNSQPLADALPSAVGASVRIMEGWPEGDQLDKDLAAGSSADPTTQVVNVSIFPTPAMGRNTTRYPDGWQQVSAAAPPTLTVVVRDEVVTFGGSADPNQVVAVIPTGGGDYHVVTAAGDTPASVATALAELIPGATAVGTVLNVPGAPLTVRVQTFALAMRETRRQEQQFQVIIWAPTPALRDATAAVLDVAFAPIRFLSFPDGAKARLLYARSQDTDGTARELLYRRDLYFTADYPTTETRAFPVVASVTQAVSIGVARQIVPTKFVT